MSLVDLEIFYTPVIGIIYKKQLKLLRPKKNEILLDAGAGIGKWCRRYEKFMKLVVGIDKDKNILKNRVNKNCVIANIESLPFKTSSTDIVLCQEVLEHVSNPQKVLDELSRVVKETGRIFLTTPNSTEIKKYTFPLTRILNQLPINWEKLPSFFSGPFPVVGYKNWKKIVGHVRDGFSAREIKTLCKKSKLKIICHKYLWKSLTTIFWELAFSNRFLNNLFKPISTFLHLVEGKNSVKEGLTHILILKKFKNFN